MDSALNMASPLLAPAAVLALWTLIMLFWMAATRFPAMAKLGMKIGSAPPGGRGQDLEGALPPSINWKSHNYTHLLEQPTLFYAVVVILHLSGGTTTLTVGLAWAYAVIRIIHSLWQAVVNRVDIRFALFMASTLCLLVLTLLAVIAAMG
jgi:hypothetical protein